MKLKFAIDLDFEVSKLDELNDTSALVKELMDTLQENGARIRYKMSIGRDKKLKANTHEIKNNDREPDAGRQQQRQQQQTISLGYGKNKRRQAEAASATH